jgi:hypothetical protein
VAGDPNDPELVKMVEDANYRNAYITLREVAQMLDDLRHAGAQAPPLPDWVVDRAKELGIELPSDANAQATQAQMRFTETPQGPRISRIKPVGE